MKTFLLMLRTLNAYVFSLIYPRWANSRNSYRSNAGRVLNSLSGGQCSTDWSVQGFLSQLASAPGAFGHDAHKELCKASSPAHRPQPVQVPPATTWSRNSLIVEDISGLLFGNNDTGIDLLFHPDTCLLAEVCFNAEVFLSGFGRPLLLFQAVAQVLLKQIQL